MRIGGSAFFLGFFSIGKTKADAEIGTDGFRDRFPFFDGKLAGFDAVVEQLRGPAKGLREVALGLARVGQAHFDHLFRSHEITSHDIIHEMIVFVKYFLEKIYEKIYFFIDKIHKIVYNISCKEEP